VGSTETNKAIEFHQCVCIFVLL